jgi:cell division transport system permease protein
LRQLLASYVRHHRETVAASLARLAATPLQTLMTMLVVAIALALPASLYTAVDNLRQLGGEVEFNTRMTVFLRHDLTPQDIDTLLAALGDMAHIEAATLVTPEEALAEFSETSGFGDVLDLLDDNPLPAVLLVVPAAEASASPDVAEALTRAIARQPQVDDVAVDLAWLQRLQALLDIGHRLVYAMGAALGIGVVVIMGNTIRLAIESRRDEIVVVKLIGGTDRYVRRPFLYGGLWFGFGGGLLAWLLVWLGVLLVGGTVGQLAVLYQSGFAISGPGFGALLLLLSGGALLGSLGAWIAVSQHLRHIEPE